MPARRSSAGGQESPQAPDRHYPVLVNGEQYTVAVERASGFGQKYNPFTPAEAQDILGPQITRLRDDVANLPDEIRGPNVVFEAKLLANYFAGSYFPQELIRRADLEVVGSRSAEGRYLTRKGEEERQTRTLLLSGADESFDALEDLIGSTPDATRVWEHLTRLDTLRLTPPDAVLRRPPSDAAEGELITWEAVLHPLGVGQTASARRVRGEVLQKWAALINELSGEVDLEDLREVDGLAFIPVALTLEGARSAARFNPLRCLRPMPKVRPLAVPVVQREHEGFTPTPLPASMTPRTEGRIAVIDGGVDMTCPFMQPFVRQINCTPEPPDADDVAHGTAVTTTVLYGYVPEDGVVPRPDIGVDHYRVMPLPPVPRTGSSAQDVDRELYWLLDQITDAVDSGDYRIVNLSIGPKLAVDEDGEPDRWTSTLDRLARDKNVLFVTAAGNDGQKPPDEGLHRVQVPADMVNGLGVGACTSRTGTVDRCAYSSQGPGRWGARIQPAGVAFGGRMPSAPFAALLAHGELGFVEGTSFAAPVVTHGLGGLTTRIGVDDATPDLLRAFAVHFAERRSKHHDLSQLGYGRFRERYDDLWIGTPDTVTVVYQDVLRRGGVAGFVLPFPASLQGAATTVALHWTVCVTAPVAAKEPADYTLAGFDVTFRPHARVFSFSDSNTRKSIGTANIDTERVHVRALLRAGGERSRMPVTYSAKRIGRTEHGRREAGWWETTVQQRIARMPAEDLHSPSVELKYVAREGGALQREADVLPFTMVVTVQTARSVGLYDAVLEAFPLLAVAGPQAVVQTGARVRT